ncbi:MAG: tetratricopeptide repeat protein [Thermosynechococcaceae cyanobacterium]
MPSSQPPNHTTHSVLLHRIRQGILTNRPLQGILLSSLGAIGAQSLVLSAVALPFNPIHASAQMHKINLETVIQTTAHPFIGQKTLTDTLYAQTVPIPLDPADTQITVDPNGAIAANLPSPATLNNRGIELMNQGDIQAALTHFNQALQRNPHFAPAYNNRAMIQTLMGDLDAAVQDYTASLTYNPQDATVYVNRGLAYASLNQANAAIADFTSALRIDSNNAQAYHSRALALLSANQPAAARADAQRAASLYWQQGDQATYQDVQEMLKAL